MSILRKALYILNYGSILLFEGYNASRKYDMKKTKNNKAAGSKRNLAGEQVHGSYSLLEGVDLRGGFWSAGFAKTGEGFWL